jgi:hypothetical protein
VKFLKKQVIYLTGILIIVWSSIILGAYIAAAFLINLSIPVSGKLGAFLTNITRTILGIALALIWLYGWKKLYTFYFQWNLKKLKNKN